MNTRFKARGGKLTRLIRRISRLPHAILRSRTENFQSIAYFVSSFLYNFSVYSRNCSYSSSSYAFERVDFSCINTVIYKTQIKINKKREETCPTTESISSNPSSMDNLIYFFPGGEFFGTIGLCHNAAYKSRKIINFFPG